MDPAIIKWIETQSPLWVIYALVVVAIIRVGMMLLRWMPVVFEKHCLLIDTATQSISESATAISNISTTLNGSANKLGQGQSAIADAAAPACKAILVVTPPDKKTEVKEHLDEVVKILTKPTLLKA